MIRIAFRCRKVVDAIVDARAAQRETEVHEGRVVARPHLPPAQCAPQEARMTAPIGLDASGQRCRRLALKSIIEKKDKIVRSHSPGPHRSVFNQATAARTAPVIHPYEATLAFPGNPG